MQFSFFLQLAVFAAGQMALANITEIRSQYKTGEIIKLCDASIAKAKDALKKIVELEPKARTLQNTILAFDSSLADFGDETGPLEFMKEVLPDAKLREEAAKCEQATSDFGVEIFTRRDLYNAMKDQKGKTAIEKRLVMRVLEAFERSGLKLSDEKLAKVREIKARLAKLGNDFQTNLTNDASVIRLTVEELKGMRPDFIASQKKDKDGTLLVVPNSSVYKEVTETAELESTRKAVMLAFFNRAAKENTPMMEEALLLRQELAKILGFKTWADFAIKPKMAKNAATVEKFLSEMRSKLKIRNRQDFNQLLAFKKLSDPKATVVNQWDQYYLEDQLKKRDFKLNQDEIREYFPADVVVKGMFDLYARVLGLTFKEVPKAPVWHESVKKYEIYDKGGAKPIGFFYADFFPRQGKYSHAAAFTLIKGRNSADGKYNLPISAVVSNFTPPGNGKPSLLTHRDVETMFHEFGHIMHQTLTRVPYASLSGTSVARDFVEAPSQMLENWVWEPSVLGEISGHYKDHSKKLPPEMLKALIRARDFQQGRFYTRQLLLSTYDMTIHTRKGKIDVTKTYDDLYKSIINGPQIDGAHFPATFGHMMGGYDAGYYGYMWSEAYAQDMFTVFEKKGITSADVGKRYRTHILEAGDSVDASELLKRFLGRPANNKAFLKMLKI